MDFFDNALDKAKEAIEIVSKRTEEVVLVGKQKYNIAALKNKNSKCFESLGRLYFEKLTEAEIQDEQAEVLVKLILENQEKIAELQEELEP